MHPVMERAAERKASSERTMPKVGGLNASQLTGEMSTGHWRTKRSQSYGAHQQGSARRFGVKPSSGAVSDLYAVSSVPGQPDGSSYFDEWLDRGGLNQLPVPKTRKQDELHRLCVAFIAGEPLEDTVEEGMREFIAKIIRTDPEHGNAWRLAMGIAGLYSA